MGIRLKTPMAQIRRELRAESERMHKSVLRTLRHLGERCVTKARDRAPELSWYDRTGNLRSSIGYVVAYDGGIVTLSDFGDQEEGAKEGRALAQELATRTKGKYVLIVVAGMHYAEYVEAMENKDVLATPELYAKKRAPLLLERLAKKFNERKK